MSDVYFMSPPGKGWRLSGRANFRSREAPAVDARRARHEWLALARAIEERGGVVVALPPAADELTGLPYAAEAGHVLAPAAAGQPHRFVLPRMKAPHRQREREHWAPLARELGLEVIDPGRGIWEAQGDVAIFDGVTLLFFGGRTDREGMRAAAEHFDAELLELEIREPAFHGNMALLPLPAVNRLLVCAEVFVGDGFERLQQRFGADRIERVSESEIRRYATNGLPIGDTWLAPSVVPERVRDRVQALGMQVELLGMTELCEKAGGASRCLVCHAPRLSEAIQIPERNRLSAVARAIEEDGPDA